MKTPNAPNNDPRQLTMLDEVPSRMPAAKSPRPRKRPKVHQPPLAPKAPISEVEPTPKIDVSVQVTVDVHPANGPATTITKTHAVDATAPVGGGARKRTQNNKDQRSRRVRMKLAGLVRLEAWVPPLLASRCRARAKLEPERSLDKMVARELETAMNKLAPLLLPAPAVDPSRN